MKKITETRKINFHDLYALCNKKHWYSNGNSAEYEAMFDKAHGDMTTEKMVALAEDIIEHSDNKCFEDCEPNGTTPLMYVLFELSEIAYTFFNIEE